MKLAVVGTGYVGLVTGVGMAELGHTVSCVDVDHGKIEQLRAGHSPLYERDLPQLLQRNLAAGRVTFTTRLKEAIEGAQVVFIAVGTPATEQGEADLSQVIAAAESLGRLLVDSTIVCIKSTVPVGAFPMVAEVLRRNVRPGVQFQLVSNPEFLREGDAVHDFFHPTRVVIGSEPGQTRGARVVEELFAPLTAPVLRTNIISAQMVKYAANVFLATRVSFINEIANVCEKVGAKISDVVQGLSFDPRLGQGYLRPGIGFGGPCLVKDLKAMIRMAENYGYDPQYLKAVLSKNEHQLAYTVMKLKRLLGSVLYDKSIAVWGLSFKPGTSDVRTSLALRLVELFQQEGARVRAYDPQGMPEARELNPRVEYCETALAALGRADALVVLTGWPEFAGVDYEEMKSYMAKPVILDGVNLFDPERMQEAGFTYEGFGQ